MRKRNSVNDAYAYYIKATHAYEDRIKARRENEYRVHLRVDYGNRTFQELYPNRITTSKGIRNSKKDVMSIELAGAKSSGKCHPPYRCTHAVACKLPTLNELIVHGLWAFEIESQLVCDGKDFIGARAFILCTSPQFYACEKPTQYMLCWFFRCIKASKRLIRMAIARNAPTKCKKLSV